MPPLPGCIPGLLVLQDDPIYSQSQTLEQSRSTLPTSQLPLLFVVGSKRRLRYNGGRHHFGFAISPPRTPSPSFRVGHHPSALLQARPISAFKVPGVFLEPLELSHGHCRGFTAQDTLLANGDPCVLGFGDIGGVCKGMQSKATRQMRGRIVDSHLLYTPPPPAKQPSILGKGLLA